MPTTAFCSASLGTVITNFMHYKFENSSVSGIKMTF